MSITFQVASDKIREGYDPPMFANFANSNAYDLMRMLGLPVDCDGCVGTAGLVGVARSIVKAMNLHNKRVPYIREYCEHKEPGKCKVIDFGNSDAQILRRLAHLGRVVQECIKRNKPLVWG
jgi:hypothetical protein